MFWIILLHPGFTLTPIRPRREVAKIDVNQKVISRHQVTDHDFPWVKLTILQEDLETCWPSPSGGGQGKVLISLSHSSCCLCLSSYRLWSHFGLTEIVRLIQCDLMGNWYSWWTLDLFMLFAVSIQGSQFESLAWLEGWFWQHRSEQLIFLIRLAGLLYFGLIGFSSSSDIL